MLKLDVNGVSLLDKIFSCGDLRDKTKTKSAWWLCEVGFIMQSTVRYNYVNSYDASSVFLAAGADVRNKDLSVYEFLLYENLLSSAALHFS